MFHKSEIKASQELKSHQGAPPKAIKGKTYWSQNGENEKKQIFTHQAEPEQVILGNQISKVLVHQQQNRTQVNGVEEGQFTLGHMCNLKGTHGVSCCLIKINRNVANTGNTGPEDILKNTSI